MQYKKMQKIEINKDNHVQYLSIPKQKKSPKQIQSPGDGYKQFSEF